MPIKQERMLKCLHEAQKCFEQALEFRRDVERGLSSGNPSLYIRHLLEVSPTPTLWQCSLELEHFKKVATRNVRKAQVMRETRQVQAAQGKYLFKDLKGEKDGG
jgi:hypothetical protein